MTKIDRSSVNPSIQHRGCLKIKTISSAAYLKAILTVAALLLTSNSPAATVVQTIDFDFSEGPTNAGSIIIAPIGSFNGLISPFDGNLGELNSFTIDWLLTMTVTGTVGPTGSTSISSGNTGNSSLYVNQTQYSGMGGGGGTGGSPGAILSTEYFIMNNKIFQPADAGKTYDPNILIAILGTADVLLSYGSGIVASGSGAIDLTGTAVGTATMTYDYNPVSPVPLPAAIWLFGSALIGFAGMTRRKRS